jgi:predicted transposase YbfD/YdcC
MEVLTHPSAPEHRARHVIFACRHRVRRVCAAFPSWFAGAVRAGHRSAGSSWGEVSARAGARGRVGRGPGRGEVVTAIGEWVADGDAGVLARVGIGGARRPCEATLRRVLTRLDGEVLDAVVGAWMRTRVGLIGGRRVIAIDGKTIRGARAAGHVAPHLVAALDHTLGVVLGQVQVAAKSNEIPALRTLLAVFDLVGAVITADAMHTQTTTAAYITDRGGHYVFTVKANQRSLFARCKALPWAEIRAATSLDRGHGRRVRRTIKVVAAPDLLNFAGAVQVAQIRRTRTIAGKKSVEVVYVITSMPSTTASPTQIAAWVQGHWSTREPTALGP